mmetsp:Transcript_13618/g.50732  ORF Transcript_13618/g.50732 Transcript_13618/m.50732 type:complete len:479 (-) Transcript_13618:734-2170(-)
MRLSFQAPLEALEVRVQATHRLDLLPHLQRWGQDHRDMDLRARATAAPVVQVHPLVEPLRDAVLPREILERRPHDLQGDRRLPQEVVAQQEVAIPHLDGHVALDPLALVGAEHDPLVPFRHEAHALQVPRALLQVVHLDDAVRNGHLAVVGAAEALALVEVDLQLGVSVRRVGHQGARSVVGVVLGEVRRERATQLLPLLLLLLEALLDGQLDHLLPMQELLLGLRTEDEAPHVVVPAAVLLPGLGVDAKAVLLLHEIRRLHLAARPVHVDDLGRLVGLLVFVHAQVLDVQATHPGLPVPALYLPLQLPHHVFARGILLNLQFTLRKAFRHRTVHPLHHALPQHRVDLVLQLSHARVDRVHLPAQHPLLQHRRHLAVDEAVRAVRVVVRVLQIHVMDVGILVLDLHDDPRVLQLPPGRAQVRRVDLRSHLQVALGGEDVEQVAPQEVFPRPLRAQGRGLQDELLQRGAAVHASRELLA